MLYEKDIFLTYLMIIGHFFKSLAQERVKYMYSVTCVCYSHSRFNLLFLHDLQWLLLCPFVAMAIILLFLHGYPAADLLPLSRSKDI